MFARIVEKRYGDQTYRYVYLVENRRQKGKVKQTKVANLGRVELLEDALPRLIKSLAKFSKVVFATPEEIEAQGGWIVGPVWVGEKIWEELGLGESLRRRFGHTRIGEDGERRVFAMVLNRLMRPKSKLSSVRWIDRIWWGRRGGPNLPGSTEKKQVDGLYAAMDHLIKWKDEIEKWVYMRVRDLFSMKVEVVFYDVTSTYFEGEGPYMAERGHSRDERRRNKQIVIGVVMCGGFPVAHHVFEGSRADKETIRKVIDDLGKRFEIRRVIFVCDRGMVSEENLEYIERMGYEYIVALRRRRCREVSELLGGYEEKGERISSELWVKEVQGEDGKRYFVCHNDAREHEEREKRLEKLIVLEDELMSLRERVERGRLKNPAAIVAAVERILGRHNGKRYYRYEVKDEGQFQYEMKEESLRLEEKLDGTFVLKTNAREITAQEVVRSYKELGDVEEAFREIKDWIRIRPIYHWKDERVKSHVFICALSFLLERTLARKLREASVEMTARRAVETLETIGVIENRIRGKSYYYVTRPEADARKVLRCVGITKVPAMLRLVTPRPGRVTRVHTMGYDDCSDETKS